MADKLVLPGSFTDLTDPEQLGEFNILLSRMLAVINVIDPATFALAWIEGAAAGQVIASAGVGNPPVYTDSPTLTGATFSGLQASKVVVTTAAKALASVGPLTLPYGGTGATTLTDHGVLIGNAAAAVTATAEGATGEYLAGSTGAPPVWGTLNQAAVAGLTTTSGPTFDHLHITNAIEAGTTVRMATAIRRRYYHLALGSANPGASGATWVTASANTTGGWRLTNAAHLIRGQADVHADWDGASDLAFSVKFMVNVNNAGGGVGDTVDLRANIYYKGTGDTACKTQAVEVATVVGQSPQYKQFVADFTIDYDAGGNVVEVGDVLSIVLNLETDTSEVDDIVVTSMEYFYNTTHIGIESGDV